MTSTIDQTGRPDGHPGYCSCPVCVGLPKVTSPGRPETGRDMATLLDAIDFGDTRIASIHGVLSETNSYAKRIHWWVRLFGVVWAISLICAISFGVYAGVQAAKTGQTQTETYLGCLAKGNDSTYCAIYK